MAIPILPGTGVAPKRASFSRSCKVSEIKEGNFRNSTDFTDKDRPAEHWLLGEFADSSLSVFLGSKLDDSGENIS